MHEEFEQIPEIYLDKEFSVGKFVVAPDKKGFESFRVKSKTVQITSVYNGCECGYILSLKINIDYFPIEIKEEICSKFLNIRVVALYKKDKKEHYVGFYNIHYEEKLNFDSTDIEHLYLSFEVSPIIKERIFLNSDNF